MTIRLRLDETEMGEAVSIFVRVGETVALCEEVRVVSLCIASIKRSCVIYLARKLCDIK